MVRTAAVIPTHDRPIEFARCVAAIRQQVDLVVAVAHNCDYPLGLADLTVSWCDPEPSIARMWEAGILAAGAEHVAILNDDAVPDQGWFKRMQQHILNGAAGASGPRGTDPERSKQIAGWAFVIDTQRVMPDTRFDWWATDDAIQQRAIAAGGFTIDKDVRVPNTRANSTTRGTLQARARADVRRFVDIYGDWPANLV